MKITRRTVLRLTGAAAASLALSSCSASGSAILGSNFSSWLQQTLGISSSGAASSAASSEDMVASSLAAGEQPAASLAALPAYDADPLTGEAKRSNGRIVGVMVNNISNTSRQNARPQRGLSSADLLIECKVEGGITRFCAVFHDADSIPEIGPLRSGRDQFLQLLMPYQALYYHDGESAACTKFINVYNYSGLNIGGKSYFNTPTHPHVAHRDSRGRDVAYEHTEFTSGKEIRQAASNAGIGLKYDYDTTFFRFADYRTGEENAMQGAASGRTVSITHSDHYKTSFRYDPQSRTYKMQMYSRISGKFENTVDELNAKQLSFDSLLVCFAPIERYSGDSGDVQQVSYISGGDAYYFSRGPLYLPALASMSSFLHSARPCADAILTSISGCHSLILSATALATPPDCAKPRPAADAACRASASSTSSRLVSTSLASMIPASSSKVSTKSTSERTVRREASSFFAAQGPMKHIRASGTVRARRTWCSPATT